MPPRESCRPALVKNLEKLTFPALYIYKTIIYVHDNMGRYQIEDVYHDSNTRQINLLQNPCHRLTSYRKAHC